MGILYISWERKEEKVCREGECSRGSTVHQLGRERKRRCVGRGSVVVGVLYISWERKEEKVCGEGECSRGNTVHQLGEEGREGVWGGGV